LKEITGATGGVALGPVINSDHGFAFPEAAALKISEDQLLGNFYRSMLMGYRIEIELPDNIAKRGQLKLELSKEKRVGLKGSYVSYSRDLEPCNQAGGTD
jgi:hypothetical protein